MKKKKVFLIIAAKALFNENPFLWVASRRSKFLQCFDQFFAVFVHHSSEYYVSTIQPGKEKVVGRSEKKNKFTTLYFVRSLIKIFQRNPTSQWNVSWIFRSGSTELLKTSNSTLKRKQFCTAREGNPGNVLLTSSICLKYIYQ